MILTKLKKNLISWLQDINTFKEKIRSEGIDPQKIKVVKNGVDLKRFKPYSQSSTLRSDLQLEDKFIIGYIGTHGMAHNLAFIFDCAKKEPWH